MDSAGFQITETGIGRRECVNALILTLMLGFLVFNSFSIVHATSPPNIAVNGPASPCMSSGMQFTTTITVSNLTRTMSWQVNLTFTDITPLNYSLGSSFSTSSGTGIAAAFNATGSYLVGFTYYNGGGPITTSTQTVLVRFTWNVVSYHSPILIHIVTGWEDPDFGTLLLDPSFNNQPYTSRDYFGCGSPTVSMPQLELICLDNGASLTTDLTASNLTGVHAWQVNITFPVPKMISLKSYMMGSAFTGSSTQHSDVTSNSRGWFLLNFTYTDTATYTSSNEVTLASITWKTLTYHAEAYWHIVTSTENTFHGTYIWGSNRQQSQPYATSDGFLACQA